jgi:hypothetical protein
MSTRTSTDAAEQIVHLLGTGHVNDIRHYIQLAMIAKLDEALILLRSQWETGHNICAESPGTLVRNRAFRQAIDVIEKLKTEHL